MPGKKYSHGRGGAGNICVDTTEYVDGLSYSAPILSESKNPHYSTGRGGAGNIRKYNSVEIRIAQDIPEGPFRAPHATAAGRGGYGNLSEMHKRERLYGNTMGSSRASEESQHSRTSVESNASTASTIGEIGFARWSKNFIFRRK